MRLTLNGLVACALVDELNRHGHVPLQSFSTEGGVVLIAEKNV